jgi:hypothetical protein
MALIIVTHDELTFSLFPKKRPVAGQRALEREQPLTTDGDGRRLEVEMLYVTARRFLSRRM